MNAVRIAIYLGSRRTARCQFPDNEHCLISATLRVPTGHQMQVATDFLSITSTATYAMVHVRHTLPRCSLCGRYFARATGCYCRLRHCRYCSSLFVLSDHVSVCFCSWTICWAMLRVMLRLPRLHQRILNHVGDERDGMASKACFELFQCHRENTTIGVWVRHGTTTQRCLTTKWQLGVV